MVYRDISPCNPTSLPIPEAKLDSKSVCRSRAGVVGAVVEDGFHGSESSGFVVGWAVRDVIIAIDSVAINMMRSDGFAGDLCMERPTHCTGSDFLGVRVQGQSNAPISCATGGGCRAERKNIQYFARP
jgi:hypothetical protein